jgi:ParB family chromosome partitioning protein
VAELAIVENLQRKDLNPIEKALSFQRYLREHQCTQEDLGRRIKVDRSTIANLMRLLELPENVQSAVREGTLSAGHARALLPLGDSRQQQEFCERIQREQMSVRATEQAIQDHIAQEDTLQGRAPRLPNRRRARSPQLASLEQELRQTLGVKVEIRTSGPDRGKLTLHFRNSEEFDHLRQLLLDGATHGTTHRAG